MEAIRELVAQLGGLDPAQREAAARELYRRGCELGDAAIAKWREDAQIAGLLSGPPTVGVAVSPQHFEAIRAAAGIAHLAQVPADQDAREFELVLGTTWLDILTTRDPNASGAIARYLEKFGEGIQQVEYRARNVDRAAELLHARFGIEPVYPETRPGADGTRVNFFLAGTPEGRKVLIELVEAVRPS